VRILSDTRASLTEQYRALLQTEGVDVTFTDEGIRALAEVAAEVKRRSRISARAGCRR
jgi:ATP-dependent HslUV protease ATP-binding subunit HslU